jgi:O-antigen/teichoic acid export membrane protein
MNGQNLSTNDNGSSYVSIIGSSISLICFFAPWVGCSGKTISGADMGGDTWLIFVSSAISLAAYIFFKSSNTLSKAKPIILISSLVGLGFLLYKYFKFESNEFHGAFEIKWGSIATLVGFGLSLLGVSFLKDEQTNLKVADKNDILFCPHCGSKYSLKQAGEYCEDCGKKI